MQAAWAQKAGGQALWPLLHCHTPAGQRSKYRLLWQAALFRKAAGSPEGAAALLKECLVEGIIAFGLGGVGREVAAVVPVARLSKVDAWEVAAGRGGGIC